MGVPYLQQNYLPFADVYEEEKAVPQIFQPLPFYYVEIAQVCAHTQKYTVGNKVHVTCVAVVHAN